MVHSEQEYETVYAKLAYTCDAPLDRHLFKMAKEEGHVDAYLRKDIVIEDLAFVVDGYSTTIRLSEKTNRNSEASDVEPDALESPIDRRAQTLNMVFAIEAATRNEVEAFRSENLGSGTIDMSEVGGWIEHTADSDGPATVWITLPETAMDEARLSDISALSHLPGYTEDTELLRYVTAGARYASAIPIRLGGILEHLAEVSRAIAMRYGWTEASATTFVLTNVPPSAIGIRAKKVEPWSWSKARRRIELDLPLSATKEEVADLYVRLRDEMLGDEPKARRSLGQDTCDLAVFAARHADGHTWDEARTIWNDQHAENHGRQYSSTPQFARDTRVAYKRITSEKLDWKGKGARDTRTPPNKTRGK
jgi:hypothetical protein